MLRQALILVILVIALAFTAFWFVTLPQAVPASALAPRDPNLANGRAMLFAGGCPACHMTPDQDDRTKLGGGLALKTPFGTFYAPNISPDPTKGIGAWSEVDFVTALTKGTSPAGTHYFPVFPYGSYQNMELTDVRDLFAFLMTLPAVEDKSRAQELSFPFDIRRLVGGWKFLFLAGERYRPDLSQSPAWQRGAYLVNGPAHCAECHSPRNALGAIITSQRFAGGPNPEGEGWIPNITQKGIADWSARDISGMLENGATPDGDVVAGAMAQVVKNTAQLAPEDRAAIAEYVKSLPSVEGPRPPQIKQSHRE